MKRSYAWMPVAALLFGTALAGCSTPQSPTAEPSTVTETVAPTETDDSIDESPESETSEEVEDESDAETTDTDDDRGQKPRRSGSEPANADPCGGATDPRQFTDGGDCTAMKAWVDEFRDRAFEHQQAWERTPSIGVNPPVSEWDFISVGDRGRFDCDYQDSTTDTVVCTDDQGATYYYIRWMYQFD